MKIETGSSASFCLALAALGGVGLLGLGRPWRRPWGRRGSVELGTSRLTLAAS